MNETTNKIAEYIDTKMGKLNFKDQKFVASVILGEDVNAAIKKVYSITENNEVEIKKMTLMARPDVVSAIKELQEGNSLIIKSKISKLLPDALNVMAEAMVTADSKEVDNKYYRYNAAKDLAKIGVDTLNQETKKQPDSAVRIKIDNVYISNEKVSTEKISKSFSPPVDYVETVPQDDDDEVEEEIDFDDSDVVIEETNEEDEPY